MGSSLTISLHAHNWPRPTELGVLARDEDGRLVIARSGPLHEPLSVGQYRRAASLLITRWFEPELFSGAEEALHDCMDALTART